MKNSAFSAALAAVGAVALFALFLAATGRPPLTVLLAIAQDAAGSRLGLLETATRTTPLLLSALAAAVPARVGLVNLGAEGQLHVGAIAATAMALALPSLGGLYLLPLMVLASAFAGALWGASAGVLKAKLGVNEVLVTLMLNYVAIYLVEYLVNGPWKDPTALGWPYSPRLPAGAVLPRLAGTNLHAGLLLGVAALVLLGVAFRTTIWGLATRVIRDRPQLAKYAGYPVTTYLVGLMAIGGILAAWAGLGEVSVIQGRLRSGISPGYGYTGFVISWLAGHRFSLILPIAFLVGGIYAGADALQLTAGLPSATVDVFVGLVFLTFLARPSVRRRT